MGLLRKNLILAGIASVAMAGFLSSSGASALDGFSFSDIINRQQAQREQLLSYLTDPFGASTACESTNPDSTISCNESLFPELLYNRITDGAKLYGHDGKGVIFTDTEQLVDNNPQLRTANRGDTLNFSAKFEMERYYDDAKTMPITRIELAIGFSEGLVLSENSVSLRINNQLIPAGEYSTDSFDFDEDEQLQSGITGATVFNVPLYNGAFIYPENSTIELLYSATAGENAEGEVYGRTAYAVSYVNGGSEDTDWSTEEDLFSDSYQATAMLEGNITIRRIDEAGNPVQGAEYTIDGVKATKVEDEEGVYIYATDGDISEFKTGEDGIAVITGLPFGEYTAREVSAPANSPKVDTITQDIAKEMTKTEYGKTRFVGSYVSSTPIIDYTDFIRVFDDGSMGADNLEIAKKIDPEIVEELGEDFNNIATYDEESGTYIGPTLVGESIKKVDDTYVIGNGDLVIPYDSAIGMYRYTMKLSDTWSDLLFITNDDGTASFGDSSGNQTTLTLNSGTGCYEVSSGEGFCKDGENYIYKYHGDWYLVAYPTETEGVYSVDYDFVYYTIEELDENTLRFSMYAPISYLESSDTYYIAPMSSGIGVKKLTVAKSTVMASEYLFRSEAKNKTDELTPEPIPANPQTGDVVFKAILIMLAGIASIAITSKRLIKR
ncbi:hypothetical protein IJ102_00255 [Candidatus Saccharibacteria bacterium]|nr:hypothetical protein [Candidatus Saccharibacteria bacterium]